MLGVDPGLSRLGLAVVARKDRRPCLAWSATVATNAEDDQAQRLSFIARAVRRAIADHRPAAVAIESVAWNVNKRTALSVARATGVIMAAAAEAGVPVAEYGSLEVKNAVAGTGNADKAQVQAALTRVHGLVDVPRQPDAADAVAVAVTHLVRARFAAAAARAGAR